MNILKSLFLIIALFSLATITTNAYFSDKVTITGNQFSTGSWGNENGNNNNNQIRICHATGNGKSENYQSISPDVNGIINGHVGSSHHDGRDIIPPFDYGDPVIHFDGQNWDEAGQEIYNNNCEVIITSTLSYQPVDN